MQEEMLPKHVKYDKYYNFALPFGQILLAAMAADNLSEDELEAIKKLGEICAVKFNSEDKEERLEHHVWFDERGALVFDTSSNASEVSKDNKSSEAIRLLDTQLANISKKALSPLRVSLTEQFSHGNTSRLEGMKSLSVRKLLEISLFDFFQRATGDTLHLSTFKSIYKDTNTKVDLEESITFAKNKYPDDYDPIIQLFIGRYLKHFRLTMTNLIDLVISDDDKNNIEVLLENNFNKSVLDELSALQRKITKLSTHLETLEENDKAQEDLLEDLLDEYTNPDSIIGKAVNNLTLGKGDQKSTKRHINSVIRTFAFQSGYPDQPPKTVQNIVDEVKGIIIESAFIDKVKVRNSYYTTGFMSVLNLGLVNLIRPFRKARNHARGGFSHKGKIAQHNHSPRSLGEYQENRDAQDAKSSSTFGEDGDLMALKSYRGTLWKRIWTALLLVLSLGLVMLIPTFRKARKQAWGSLPDEDITVQYNRSLDTESCTKFEADKCASKLPRNSQANIKKGASAMKEDGGSCGLRF